MAVALEAVPVATRAGFCKVDSMGFFLLLFSSSALPAHQLRNLNEIAAGVVERGDFGGGHVGWGHGELGAVRLHTLVVGLQVVGEEHGRGLALLELGLLPGFGGWVVVERQLQLGPVRVLGRGYREPAVWPLAEVGLLGEAQYFGIKMQRFFLVVHVYGGHFDFHFVSPWLCSRLEPGRYSSPATTRSRLPMNFCQPYFAPL